ncbi:hypothetical protein GRF59_06490 [Paenibacillus sp. HJL G12]|uniref:Uncharacterized protein n=1 Tax=Paenibacillus dendrobii TaxID=2691084 RepID=A0A7X3IH96_9BACL|nr:hypothetical protein [Paenibacillus dendrobii]MWV43276.1 hypothetical protein [Paenibacillus dendrobii]
MNRRGVGAVFLATGAFLFAIRYILAALLISSQQGWDAVYYHMVLKEAGTPLLTLSVLFFIAGLVYFILGDFPKMVRWLTDQATENKAEEQERNREWEASLNRVSENDDKT